MTGILSLAILLIGVVTTIVYALLLGIGPTPTSRRVADLIDQLLPEVDGPVVELGSGWGGMARRLQKRYPKTLAYERSPLPWLVSRLRGVRVKRREFFGQSLEGASLVFAYLYPKAMERLKEKLENELAKGAWVISHTFAVPGWQPVHVEMADDLYRTPVYIYRIG